MGGTSNQMERGNASSSFRNKVVFENREEMGKERKGSRLPVSQKKKKKNLSGLLKSQCMSFAFDSEIDWEAEGLPDLPDPMQVLLSESKRFTRIFGRHQSRRRELKLFPEFEKQGKNKQLKVNYKQTFEEFLSSLVSSEAADLKFKSPDFLNPLNSEHVYTKKYFVGQAETTLKLKGPNHVLSFCRPQLECRELVIFDSMEMKKKILDFEKKVGQKASSDDLFPNPAYFELGLKDARPTLRRETIEMFLWHAGILEELGMNLSLNADASESKFISTLLIPFLQHNLHKLPGGSKVLAAGGWLFKNVPGVEWALEKTERFFNFIFNNKYLLTAVNIVAKISRVLICTYITGISFESFAHLIESTLESSKSIVMRTTLSALLAVIDCLGPFFNGATPALISSLMSSKCAKRALKTVGTLITPIFDIVSRLMQTVVASTLDLIPAARRVSDFLGYYLNPIEWLESLLGISWSVFKAVAQALYHFTKNLRWATLMIGFTIFFVLCNKIGYATFKNWTLRFFGASKVQASFDLYEQKTVTRSLSSFLVFLGEFARVSEPVAFLLDMFFSFWDWISLAWNCLISKFDFFGLFGDAPVCCLNIIVSREQVLS